MRNWLIHAKIPPSCYVFAPFALSSMYVFQTIYLRTISFYIVSAKAIMSASVHMSMTFGEIENSDGIMNRS